MIKSSKYSAGKITIMGLLLCFTVLFVLASFDFSRRTFQEVWADDLTTSVTVLNTPPVWSVDAQESAESSVTSPTNSGSVMTWVATADEPSSENYYLIICNNGTLPTANASAAPTCSGGNVNQWAVSTATADDAQATAATTTTEAFVESNDWYAWVCDGNATLPRCNLTYKQGTGATASPFNVNHRPIFTSFADDSPQLPGSVVTWTTTVTDNDVVDSADTIKLFVCKAADFTGTACGAGGTWATSTYSASNPSATTTIAIPTQDTNYSAYGYVIDNHNHSATTTQGTDSTLTVSNATPTVTAATISLIDTDAFGDLTLLTPNGTTSDFKIEFTAVDDNSCENVSSGDELASAIANVYRSGVTQASCDASGEYNANNCYPGAIGSPAWDLSCTQDIGSCTGATDTDVTWTCTFSLWHIADPTDGTSLTDSTWWDENWLASIQITDDNSSASTLTESTSGNELVSFLAFDVAASSISYGALEPGQLNDPVNVTTDLIALGNVGMDEDLYGDSMCTTWSGADSCPVSATSTIPVGEQRFATSSVAYSLATVLTASTTPTELEINVPKTTSTSTPASLNTYWGINIPATITLSGSYTGQDTITARKGEAQYW